MENTKAILSFCFHSNTLNLNFKDNDFFSDRLIVLQIFIDEAYKKKTFWYEVLKIKHLSLGVF